MSWYRNAAWTLKGIMEYTKGGYDKAQKAFSPSDLDVDCSTKIFMITGGNSGIGFACAMEIAKRDGIVHLVCRNKERGLKAKKEIEDATNNEVFLHVLDMSDPKEVAKFATSFVTDNEALDVLIVNAGCLLYERQITKDGFDAQFATNILGTYILTEGLTVALKKSMDPRVIMVTSGVMLTQKLNYKDLNFRRMSNYRGLEAYAQTKRQLVVLCKQSARGDLYPKTTFFASVNPGWVATSILRSLMYDVFYDWLKSMWRTPQEGADTILWLALSREARKTVENFENSGEYYQDRRIVPQHLPLAFTTSTDDENIEFICELWDIVQALGIKLIRYKPAGLNN